MNSTMKIRVRRREERGHLDHGWLKTWHTFSFGGYHDPQNMGYRSLRVMNEDVIAGEMGFGEHGHQDMEIVTYPISGALAHRDSTGGAEVLRAGEVQRMTAGSGIRHSEMNPEPEETHLYQIWLLPDRTGLTPGYEQKAFPLEERRGRLQLLASPDARDGSLTIHQDASIYSTVLAEGESVTHDLGPGRGAWVQVVEGSITLGETMLRTGDGAAIEDTERVVLTADGSAGAELLLFDLA